VLRASNRRGRRTRALFVPALALAISCVAFAPAPATGAEGATLTAVEIAPEGRLLRVSFRATGPLEDFALSRQGPPNERDLVVDLREVGGSSVQTTAQPPSPFPGVTYDIRTQESEGRSFVRVVLNKAGDSLVRLDHDAGTLSLLLIPLEQSRTHSADAYRIGPDDVLAISVFGHDDLSKTMKVSPDGLINFPLIGNIGASGRTVDDVAEDIQERLAANYLVDPHVTVSVWEYLSQWVNVIGAVMKPGRYYMTGPMTVIDAISQAGGVTSAASDTIQVTRRRQQSDPASAGEVISVSTASLLGEGAEGAVVRLRPGDVVNVVPDEKAQVAGQTPGSRKSPNR